MDTRWTCNWRWRLGWHYSENAQGWGDAWFNDATHCWSPANRVVKREVQSQSLDQIRIHAVLWCHHDRKRRKSQARCTYRGVGDVRIRSGQVVSQLQALEPVWRACGWQVAVIPTLLTFLLDFIGHMHRTQVRKSQEDSKHVSESAAPFRCRCKPDR